MASLVSEYSVSVVNNHVIKSSEQALYNQKTVYSTPKLDSCEAASSSNDSFGSTPVITKIKNEIKSATKVAANALTGKGSGSSGEVDELRKMIEDVKLQNESLKKEVDELRVLVGKHCPNEWPAFSQSHQIGTSILVLGDGNFSFTLSLSLRFPEKRIIGSVFESREEFLKRYSSGSNTIQRLETLPNTSVCFGVDATRIDARPTLVISEFSDIIMNFPHHCGKTNLRRSRQLLHGIFDSLSNTLMTNGTRFHLTLANGQSGLNEELVYDGQIYVDHILAHNPDSWQAVYLAAEYGLRLLAVRSFDARQFPEYKCAGYLNREQRFHNERRAVTLTFVKAYEKANLRKEMGGEIPTLKAVKRIEEQTRRSLDLLLSNKGDSSAHETPPKTSTAAPAGDADEDFDLFGSDDDEERETEEQKRIREERLTAYAAKKAKKPDPIAKSSVILDVKPWDDETDLNKMAECVKSIKKDGLVWGASKFIPIGYGIKKLQIVCTIEDEKVSVDADLVEHIQEEFADFVQSVDIVAFNKI